jgi:hypothetical protein
MECKRCLFTSDIAIIGEKQCNYCDIHDQLEAQSNPKNLQVELSKVRKQKGKYNCIMGISGGLDSSVLLYLAVKHWGLKPLVIHFDNNWNNDIAKQNMDNLINKLGVDAITYRVNKTEYDLLNDAFLFAGVPDADIPNDIAMTKLMYDTADKYGIKYILNGHCFRTEGSTPAKWTYMDAKYIQSVYKWYTESTLSNYPLFTFKDQIYYALKGIKNIRPFHYINERSGLESEMIDFIGWKSYGYKHTENVYTEYVGFELLPNKFNINKKIVYLSAQVRSGLIDKETALEKLNETHEFDFEKLGDSKERIMMLSTSRIKDRELFKRYNFKKYKYLIWLLSKMKVVPHTFYVKYAK